MFIAIAEIHLYYYYDSTTGSCMLLPIMCSCMVHGVWWMVNGVYCIWWMVCGVYCIWWMVNGVYCIWWMVNGVYCIWWMVCGVWCMVNGERCILYMVNGERCIQYMVNGVRCMVWMVAAWSHVSGSASSLTWRALSNSCPNCCSTKWLCLVSIIWRDNTVTIYNN